MVKDMYEKYTGLPDTSKRAPEGVSPSARTRGGSTRDDGEKGMDMDMYDAYSAPQRGGSSARSGSSSGGGSSSRRASSSSSSRSQTRKKKARQRRLTLFYVTVGILVLLAFAVALLTKSCADNPGPGPQIPSAGGVFDNNVYINSLNISGMTVDEARGHLASGEEYTANNVAVTLTGGEIFAVITGPEMGAATNLDELLAQALSGGPNQSYYTSVSVDEGALASCLDAINETLSNPPVDPSVKFVLDESGRPRREFTEGQPGYGMDVAATEALILAALSDGSYQPTIVPELTVIQPVYTKEDVEAHVALLGSFTTTYDFKGTAENTSEEREFLIPNRAFNVEKGATLISNRIVKPGRTFSFNSIVGDRTEKNGWLEANGIFGGDRLNKQFGGGICQVSTTLYNAVMQCYPYIEIIEWRNHSFPSTYVDKGLDATVDTGHIDFRFRNTSDYPLYIFAYVTTNKKVTQRKRDLTVEIYGEALPNGESYKLRSVMILEEPFNPEDTIYIDDKKMPFGEEKVVAEGRNSFTVEVYLDKYVNGNRVDSILWRTVIYNGNPPRKYRGTMTPSPSPNPTPTPT